MTQSIDNYRLKHLLALPDLHHDSIYSLIGRMKSTLDFFHTNQNYRPLIPFLQVYYLVTKHVAEKFLHKGSFRYHTAMEQLDLYFGSLYFEPLTAYLLDKEHKSPWKTYFEYAERPDGLPFIHMLLGINAHINTDLVTTLVMTKYRHHKDYALVNKILAQTIIEIVRFLFLHDPDLYSVGGIIFPSLYQQAFKHTVIGWRKQAWENAQGLTPKQFEHYYPVLCEQTEQIGHDLITIFSDMHMSNHVSDRITKLYDLRVSLPHR